MQPAKRMWTMHSLLTMCPSPPYHHRQNQYDGQKGEGGNIGRVSMAKPIPDLHVSEYVQLLDIHSPSLTGNTRTAPYKDKFLLTEIKAL